MKKRMRYIFRFIFWNISRIFVYWYIRPKFRYKLADPGFKMPKHPYFIISNHGTFFDPWLTAHLCASPVSIMMNEEGFKTSKFAQWYLRSIGTFPKKKGQSDVRALKYTLKEIKDGYTILIFPEGQTTWDGETQPIYGGMEAIIKRAKIPVVCMRLEGNFMSKPWWSETFRRGQVMAHRKLLSPDQIASMGKEEIRSEIIDFIKSNDVKAESTKSIEFKGPSPAPGIERFLWLCPVCSTSDAISGQDEYVTCSQCQAKWKLDNHFVFEPASDNATSIGDIQDFASWHKEQVKMQIAEAADDTILASSDLAELCEVSDLGKYQILDTGTLTLTRNEMRFVPIDTNSDTRIWPVEDIKDPVFQLKTVCEFRVGKAESYKFSFDGKSPMKWVYYLRYLKDYSTCEEQGYQ